MLKAKARALAVTWPDGTREGAVGTSEIDSYESLTE
jgi:hypothetical protein